MSAEWPRCDRCGRGGWRYLTAHGRTGWRCWCGAHRPDQIDTVAVDDVQLPLFDLEVSQ